MSDDIDRLKNLLEDFHNLKDGLTDGRDAMRDVVAAVKQIDRETDPEGHAALRDITRDICLEGNACAIILNEMYDIAAVLEDKARA